MRKVREVLAESVMVELFGAMVLYVGSVAALLYPVVNAIQF